MSDSFLYAAGGVGLVTSLVHQYLGQKKVIANVRAPQDHTLRLLSAIWFLSTLYWASSSIVLMATPILVHDSVRHYLVLTMAGVLASGAFGNFWAMKGRHVGWVLLATASILAFLGR